MSAPTAIDPRESLGHWSTYMMSNYVSDIPAIPEDKWTASLGGCARPASEMTAEVVSILDWTTDALNGVARTTDEKQLIAEYQARCSTRDGAQAELSRCVPAFVEALKSASDEKLGSMVTAPWGSELPLMMMAHVASSHLWYHDGQLNYMQCLLGDGDYHW